MWCPPIFSHICAQSVSLKDAPWYTSNKQVNETSKDMCTQTVHLRIPETAMFRETLVAWDWSLHEHDIE